MRTVNIEKAQIRRREILDAAKHCFEQKGFHATTMAEICSRAVLSPGALYRYFDSKEAIIDAMAFEGSMDAAQLFDDAIDELNNGAIFPIVMNKFFEAILSKYFNNEYGAMASELIAEAMRNPSFSQAVAETYCLMRGKFCEILKHGQKQGFVDQDLNPIEAATMIMATMDGLMLRMTFNPNNDKQETSKWLLNIFKRYLSPQPTQK